MRLVLTGRHVDITPGIRRLVDRKLTRLERLLGNALVSSQVVLTLEDEPTAGRGDKVVHSRYVGALTYGRHTLGWEVPRKKGGYTVSLAVRDLAGNPASVSGDVEVLPPRKKRKRG